VLALKPDLLMVEKTVSRLAQDLLRDAGVTLIVNMKPNLMERLSRATRAPILASMDYADRDVLLGTCGVFRMTTFDTRTPQQQQSDSQTNSTDVDNRVNDMLGHWRLDQGQAHRGKQMSLMFVEGCPSNLHCTVCLRGDTRSRLRKVKRILLTAIHVAYSLALESALLIDQCATYDDG
jgi:1-phosphatidylinositol-3-phosphate 5-kinase